MLVSACGFVVLVASGCATGPPKSGFLGDYSNFEKVRDDAPMWDFTDRTVEQRESRRVELWRDVSGLTKLGQYERIIVEPTVLRLRKDSRGVHIDPAMLNELAQYAHDSLVTALQDRYPVADQPGQGVLRFRVAITDVYPSDVFVQDQSHTAKVANSSAGGGTIEGEAVDSVSGDRVFGIIGKIKGSRWDAVREQGDDWKQTKSSIAAMARFVRELMDRAQSGALEQPS
jgi:hypothetical protein